ncbi:MAG: C4-dicarboxylate TRAP transporter substrate-binding protein [Bifidobacteriaceae bacterium]|jgi:TRAP-type C4-dicarboxylate transport system substrate-binding protein|nr:C4-dicarboxylate TRAP transporter substrate-binding protein [Bifidobacteriaceae bacterium]
MKTSTKTRLTAWIALAPLALAAAACGDGVVADPADKTGTTATAQDLAFSVFAPEGSSLSQTLKSWADSVTEATDGAITFTFHWNAALLAADDTLQGTGDGRADIGFVGALYYESQLPFTSITGVPYLAPNAKAAMLSLRDMYESSSEMKAEYARNNVVPLFFLPARDALLGAKDKPISSIGDLKGRSIRAAGSFSVTLAEVGANPVSIVFNELYESLQRGVVDSYSGILLDSIEVAALYEVAPYVANPRQGLLSTYPVSINADTWDGLSEDVKKIMQDKAADAIDAYFGFEAAAYASACDTIAAAGGTVSVWGDTERQAWADVLGDDLLQAWRERVGGGDAATAFERAYVDAMSAYDQEFGLPTDGVAECAARF